MSWGRSSRWRWPESLDALEAAPDHHTLLFENEHVRVLETHIPPGATVPVHTHRWPSTLYVTAWAECVRRDDEGNVLVDTRKTGGPPTLPAVLWSGPLPPHSLENLGPGEIRFVSVEIKDKVR